MAFANDWHGRGSSMIRSSRQRQTARNAQRRGGVHHEVAEVETASPEWQAATEALLMAAEDRGPLMRAHEHSAGPMRSIFEEVLR
jgi:hypothetical protein